ncbi:MAG: hypothetical protein IJM47_04905 [Synergistaceae bacterium]|nr:hypothetical protein [Synergistaceae bacterium]
MSGIKKYTKSTIIAALKEIRSRGWVKSHRNSNNDGAVGNTLEDLLGIQENNLPLPNAAEWELKTQKRSTTSLLTLFHLEPSPRGLHIADYLLENFGWPHKNAGTKYPVNEKSFRQTLSYHQSTRRGFYVIADVRECEGEYFYLYSDIMQLQGFSLEKFLFEIKEGNILIDFDARTGHNHGTKFRIKQNAIPLLYEKVKNI